MTASSHFTALSTSSTLPRFMRRHGAGPTMAAATALCMVLAACGGSDDDNAGSPSPPAPNPGTGTAAPSVVASGLKAPWSIAFYNGTALVSERDTAKIVAIGANGSLADVATIAGVNGGGEGGLLGIAVRDNFLYVYFTAGADNRIVRYPLAGSGTGVQLGVVQPLLSGIPAANIHNGGRIAFGPDGMLYATTGDAADTNRAQNLSSLAGKILRMMPTGDIPADNPIAGSYVYSYGHRNPQGLAWASNGTMYASEFGQNTWDELNQIKPGANYGWPVVEGKANDSRYTDPLQQWSTSTASPSGMAIAGTSIYIANLRGERLRQIPLATPGTATERYVSEYGRLRDAVVAPDGRLWLLTNNTDGRGQPNAGDDRIISVPLQ